LIISNDPREPHRVDVDRLVGETSSQVSDAPAKAAGIHVGEVVDQGALDLVENRLSRRSARRAGCRTR
jgi:hypothetical protein